MLKVRIPLAVPFAVLAALAAACSSSSGPTETTDAGKTDTGTTKKPDTGTVSTGHDAAKDTGTTKKPDTGTTTDASVAAGPTVPAGATAILTKQFVNVLGMTTDDHLIYQDNKGNISATDITGKVTMIAPGPTTDGGNGPIAQVDANVVAILTDYTTKSVDGNVEAIAGTLSIWTSTLGTLKQVATNSTGILAVATDSSLVVYGDAANAQGTTGNIGVVKGDGTGAVDIISQVVLDETSTTCFPYVGIDKTYVVTSTCFVSDAGADSTPQITSFSTAGIPTAPTPIVLATDAAPVNLATPPGSINFVTDTSGNNVITLSGNPPVLNVIPIAGGTPTVLQSPFTNPTVATGPSMGTGQEFFYLSTQSTFALFTEPGAALGKATFATPTSAPVISSLNMGPILGVQAISPNEQYDVDYNTPLNASSEAPTSLYLRNISTGAAFQLASNSEAESFGGVNSFTADGNFVIFTTDLSVVDNLSISGAATIGTLFTAPVSTVAATPTGAVNQLVTTAKVWAAQPLTGKNLIYNTNYVPNSTFDLPNGAATADIYVQAADGTGAGTLVVTAADAPDLNNVAFFLTADKSHLFFTFSQGQLSDSGMQALPFDADGLYVIPVPSP